MKTSLQRYLSCVLATLCLLMALVSGLFSSSVAAASSFSRTQRDQPPTPPVWGLKLYVNGFYHTTDETINHHLQMHVNSDKVILQATWEGGPLPKGYAVRFSDGGSFLGQQPEGTMCVTGATVCRLDDTRTEPIPGRWYYAELLRPAPFRNESTYENNRVYVDWVS